MRFQQIPWPQTPEWFAAGTCAGVSAVAAAASEVAMHVLGVPLPVVLAAAAGALIARSYAEKTTYGRAIGLVLAWTVLGCALAPLAQALATSVAKMFGLELALPTNVLAAFAGIAAAAPCWVPLVWPMVLARLGMKGVGGSGQ